PKVRGRKPIDTIIVSRDSPYVEIQHKDYNDARAMSPRRESEETEKMGEEAKQGSLPLQAKALKEKLLGIEECVESFKSEHGKLEDRSRFLQVY
ncbi:hypothetical protein K469DRAFT_464164, partial [Zopfia rhizophila CBS 207.26]